MKGNALSLASQSTNQRFPFAYDNVFANLLDVLDDLGMSVKSKDKVIGRVTASTGMSLFSWGENLTIVLQREGEGSTIVGIDSSLKLGTNIAGAHRHHKNFEKIISALSSRLQQATESANQGR